MSVTIRYNKLKSGMNTPYFDIYFAGRSTYRAIQDIKVYDSPKTKAEREYNKEAKLRLSIMKTELELELQQDSTKIMTVGSGNSDFIAFFQSMGDKHKYTPGTHSGWVSSLTYFKKFSKGKKVTFNDINDRMLYEFREYLLNDCAKQEKRPLVQGSSLMYFDKFKSAILKAYKIGLLKSNPAKNLDPVKSVETKREFLTKDELQSLTLTPCSKEILKTAFLFSCYTGLRHCDILNLQWSDISYSDIEKRWKISHRQQKTKSVEVLPLSKSAADLILPLKSESSKVFVGLKYDAYMNTILRKWLMKAGITKNITFHCARHTFATLLLAKGGQPTTIQKLLGHKNLAQTMIYAKIVDSQKNETVDLLDNIF